MSTIPRVDDPCATGCDALAPLYDEFTSHHRYEEWTRDLEALAKAYGLRGRRLLDIACGTGKSFIPFLTRGYAVTACDVSPAMLERARRKPAARGADLHVGDMRILPDLGENFDLITCLDDSLNYLVSDDDLYAAFCEARARLAPDGRYLFDVNSLRTYRSFFSGHDLLETSNGRFQLDGDAPPDCSRGALCTLTVRGTVQLDDGRRILNTSRHVQRHHPRPTVERLLRAAGLTCVAVAGQRADGGIDPAFYELRHTKAIYVASVEAPNAQRR
jgi:SAM-dependent methyltransferase